jgi:hypothetical protein
MALKINNISDYGFILTFPFKILTYEKTVNKENTLEKCGLYPSLFITFDVLSKYQQPYLQLHPDHIHTQVT